MAREVEAKAPDSNTTESCFAEYSRAKNVSLGDVKSTIPIETEEGSKNVIWNANKQSYELEAPETDVKKSGNSAWNLLAGGGGGLLAYAASGLITKKPWLRVLIGGGAGYFLISSGTLRDSLSPIMEGIEQILPEGPVKDTFAKWKNETSLDKQKERQENAVHSEDFAKQQMDGVSDSASKVLGVAKVPRGNYAAVMRNNGASFGAKAAGSGRPSCVFSKLAQAGEKSNEVVETRNASKTVMSEVEKSWRDRIANGEDIDVVRHDMVGYYQRVFMGVASYNEGANHTLTRDFYTDPTVYELGKSGLEMTNRATMEPVLDSMYHMNEEYHLFTQDDLSALNSYPIGGIGMVTEYVPGCFSVYEVETANAISIAQDMDLYETSGEKVTSSSYVDTATVKTPEGASMGEQVASEPAQQQGSSKTLEQASSEQGAEQGGTQKDTESEKPITSGSNTRALPDISGILMPRAQKGSQFGA